MAVDIHKLIAAINPDLYCKPDKVREVKKLVKEKGYLEAAEEAEVKDSEIADIDKLELKTPLDKPGLSVPIEKFTLTYETTEELLEQVYFWLHDKVVKEYSVAEKLIDNFVASPGSAFFSEWTMKAQQAQKQAMDMMGLANQVVRTILNLIYELREFKLRLEPYDKLTSKDENEVKAAKLSLKQLWLDQVDIRRGNTAIKALSISGPSPGQAGPNFVTLLPAFMETENLKDIEKLDLNEIVRNVLRQRSPRVASNNDTSRSTASSSG